MDSKTQKSRDLVRRKAVSWNGMFGGPLADVTSEFNPASAWC
jgi:hypothetical protein